MKQKTIQLSAFSRGFYLVTDVIDIGDVPVGILHVFITHTSASITINENADLTVRKDLKIILIEMFQRTPHTICIP